MENFESQPKPIVFLHGEIKTPPLSLDARVRIGQLLRRLQNGEMLAMPRSRPMPSVGAGCHELRVNDQHSTWRIIYRLDSDAIVIAEVFQKKTEETPPAVIQNCQKRLALHDADLPT